MKVGNFYHDPMPNKRTAFNKAMNLAVFNNLCILLAETRMTISAIREKRVNYTRGENDKYF